MQISFQFFQSSPSCAVPLRGVSGSDGVVRAEGPRPLTRAGDFTPQLSKVSCGHDAPAIDLHRLGQVDAQLASTRGLATLSVLR